MNIALIISGFPIQGYLRDLIDSLTQRGHEVVLYKTGHRENTDTTDLDAFPVPVRTIEARGKLYRWLRAADKVLASIHPSLPGFSVSLLSLKFSRCLQNNGVDLFIGVEKTGLIIAAALAKKRGKPYAYYSLELYVENHPNIAQYHYLRRLESEANARALFTLIQDARRAGVLADANKLHEHRFIYLPIGITGPAVSALPDVNAENRNGKWADKIKILYVGMLSSHRRIDELIQIADALDDDAYLHLHGPNFFSNSESRSKNNLVISKATLPEKELLTLVANSDIGVALYYNEPLNDRLTAFSSHKIALYLKYGKPIIVPRNESYEDLMTLYRCGEMIDDISEIPAAVKKITRQYDNYSSQALLAFDRFYNISLNAPRIIDAIEQLMKLD